MFYIIYVLFCFFKNPPPFILETSSTVISTVAVVVAVPLSAAVGVAVLLLFLVTGAGAAAPPVLGAVALPLTLTSLRRRHITSYCRKLTPPPQLREHRDQPDQRSQEESMAGWKSFNNFLSQETYDSCPSLSRLFDSFWCYHHTQPHCSSSLVLFFLSMETIKF